MLVPIRYIRKLIKILQQLSNALSVERQFVMSYPYKGDAPNTLIDKQWNSLIGDAYKHGFVISNYSKVIEEKGLNTQKIREDPNSFVKGLDELGALACIALIYRHEHWTPGTLKEYVREGILLQYFMRLMEIATAEKIENAGNSHLCPYCLSVHTAPIVYGLPATQDFKHKVDYEEIYFARIPALHNGPTHYCFSCNKWIYL